MAKKNAVIEEYYRLRYAGQPDYCGKKDRLAYAIAYGDQGMDCYRSEVYVKELQTGRAFRVTAGGLYENYPRLSPDGEKLLFVSDVTGTAQIYTAEKRGTDYETNGRPLTHMRYDVHDPIWSPDGSRRAADLCGALSGRQPGRRPGGPVWRSV